MKTPLPPLFNIISALAGHASRRPSNAPAAALWLHNPTTPRISLDHRDAMIQQFLEFLYEAFEPEIVDFFRAEAAGLPPLRALELFGSHLDDKVNYLIELAARSRSI